MSMFDGMTGQRRRGRRPLPRNERGIGFGAVIPGIAGTLRGLFGGGGGSSDNQGLNDALDVFGSLLGAIYGVQGQADLKKAFEENRKENEKRYSQGLGLFDEARTIGHDQLNYAGQELQRNIGEASSGYNPVIDSIKGNYAPILKQLRGGYASAINDVQNVGREAGRRITETGAQQQSAGLAGLQSRGLGGTTIAPQFQMAVQRDTNRARADLDERIAGLRSGIRERGANAVAGVQENRAGMLAGARTGAARAGETARRDWTDFLRFRPVFESGLAQDKAGFIERRQDVFNLPLYLQMLQGSQAAGGGGGGSNPISRALGFIPQIFGIFNR